MDVNVHFSWEILWIMCGPHSVDTDFCVWTKTDWCSDDSNCLINWLIALAGMNNTFRVIHTLCASNTEKNRFFIDWKTPNKTRAIDFFIENSTVQEVSTLKGFSWNFYTLCSVISRDVSNAFPPPWKNNIERFFVYKVRRSFN